MHNEVLGGAGFAVAYEEEAIETSPSVTNQLDEKVEWRADGTPMDDYHERSAERDGEKESTRAT